MSECGSSSSSAREHDRNVVDGQKHSILVGLPVRPGRERIVGLDPPDAALVLGVVAERARVDDVLADPLVPVHDRRIVGEERQHAADLGEVHSVGRVAGEHAVLGRVERRRELQVEQLVAPRRIGIVRIEKDRRKAAAGNLHAGAPKAKSVVALEHRHVVGARDRDESFPGPRSRG